MANHRNRRSSTPLSEGAWFRDSHPLAPRRACGGPGFSTIPAQGLSRCLVPAAAIRPGVAWNRIAPSILPYVINDFPAEVAVTVQVDEVQSVPDGFGFHLKASEYTWITVVFETKDEAEAAHKHAAKAVDGAKALKIVNR
jgi:hypothetical protein